MLKARLILFISYQFLKKECDESMYWLELLMGTNYISKAEFESMHNQCGEVLKIIKSIIITSKKNLIQNS